MLEQPVDAPVERMPVRLVLAWLGVVLVVAAGLLLVVADRTPQAEVEHLWSTDGAATYTAWPDYGAVDAPDPGVVPDIAPQDAPAARRLALLASAAGVAAIVVARTRRMGPLFGVLVAVTVLSLAAAPWLGVGSTAAYAASPQDGTVCGPDLLIDCPTSSNGLGDGIIEQWDWRTPQLAWQLGAAGLLLVAAGVTRAAHRPVPELQLTLTDRDVARLLR